MDFKYILLLSTIFFSVGFNLMFQWIYIHKKKFDPINVRSSHNTLATRTGGISLFSTLFIFTLYFYFLKNELYDFSLIIPLSIIFVIGVYDDFYDADFKLKFFIQIIVAKLIIDNGFLINNLYGTFGIYEIPNLLAQFITVLMFLIIVNSINFIDGIDGLTTSYSIYSIISIQIMHLNSSLSILNLICIGSLLPLFYFNFKRKNKVFLGDAGSLFLGCLIALNVFLFLNNSTQLKFEGADKRIILILILFYPLFDLARVSLIRIYNKKSPFEADKNHLHHLLLKKIKPHFLIVMLVLSLNILLYYSYSFYVKHY